MFETCALVKPSNITVYSKYLGERRRSKSPPLRSEDNSYAKAFVSRKASQRFKAALENLIYTAKWKTVWVRATNSYFRYKVNFITLTLPAPQEHTDNEIVKVCLSPFLENWQKRRPGFLYAWKAEVQDNGNIHFHLITNAFIHYKRLRKLWNKSVEKLGYVSRSSAADPNSTDVHALDNKKDIAGYLVSYLNKKDLYKKPLKRYFQIYGDRLKKLDAPAFKLPRRYFTFLKRGLTCRAWSASKMLLDKGFTSSEYDRQYEHDWRMLVRLKEYAIQKDYITIYPLDKDCLRYFPGFSQALTSHFDRLIQEQKKAAINETIEDL